MKNATPEKVLAVQHAIEVNNSHAADQEEKNQPHQAI
jgi:hypothetical protein